MGRAREKWLAKLSPGRCSQRTALKCVPWGNLNSTQQASIERLRREVFPGKRGDTITCHEWTNGNLKSIPGLDIRDTTLLKNSMNHSVVVALKGNVAIGYAAWLDYKNSQGRASTYLGYIAVKKSHRRQGVGRFLMGKFSDRGTQFNLDGVLNSTPNALGFYKKMGWKFTPKKVIKAGRGFDMANPERIVGKTVRFKYKDGKWYTGEVRKYRGGSLYEIYADSLKTQKLAAYHVEHDITAVRVVG